MDMKSIVLDIYKSNLEKEQKNAGDNELENIIYQLLLDENASDLTNINELLYKAGDRGHELGFLEGFKTAIRLITECLI